MPRNLDKRVELMFPIENPDLRRLVRRTLELFFLDNRKAHTLGSDGAWTRKKAGGRETKTVRAQEEAYNRIRDRLVGDEPENREEFKVRRRPPE
jgi:polyphosphate kinase